MTEIKRVQEYDNKKTSLPAPLNIIFRRSPLSVIVRLDRQSIIFYLVFWDTPVMRSEYLTCKIKIIF